MNSYFGATEEQIQEMLEAIGVKNLKDLFAEVPAELELKEELALPPALDEPSLSQHIEQLAKRNLTDKIIFAGGGIYDHYIPPVIDYLVSRGEFLTAYTPYQAEASQGILQATFEYQTMICEITGMDIANASIYDGATALAEAVLMVLSSMPGRNEILILRSVNPQYTRVIKTYLRHTGTIITEIDWHQESGTANLNQLMTKLNKNLACLVLQQPNFFGCIEDTTTLIQEIHNAGAKAIVVVDPVSLGVLRRPGEYGADIVVAEGQPLGLPMYAGGETVGIFACREEFLRLVPGRLVGMTVDAGGKRAFTLTLQTREQHIRRERATSNICTNQALNALRVAIYLALVGKSGFRHLATLCAKRTFYLQQQLKQSKSVWQTFQSPVFRELTVSVNGDINELKHRLTEANLVVGPYLGEYYPELKNSFIIALTEKRTREQINRLLEVLQQQ
ncbi:MAG: aminomethyl-transferring glycine dehydrogenase subunit GcvPA [Candidatus Sumerlaeia bacterium]|nr:aminomethyl-transferring glycine dehydrogenase subunit GcvPA [Candidatus Sumerlaeia bacterium]